MSLSSDTSDDFPIFTGTLLGPSHRIQTFLGEGGFGYVAKCEDTQTKKSVAVKICKKHPAISHQAQRELAVLRSLQTLDPDACNIIRWHGSFLHEERICLEFELLDQSLFDFMEQRRNEPLPVRELRPLVHQLATALTHLESVGVIHADIKPDNIMIVDRQQRPLHVKLIDFGIACDAAAAAPEACVQTLWYRAPEVTLGLDVSGAIDVWSLGLVAAELALGFPLYPAEHEYDLMRFIVETQGQPAGRLLNGGSKSSSFFHKHSEELWRLKSPEEFAADTGYRSEETRSLTLSSLDDIEQVGAEKMLRGGEERGELRGLAELLKRMLQLDARERVGAAEVLRDPFFRLSGGRTRTPERNEPRVSRQRPPAERPATLAAEAAITQHPPSACVSLEGEVLQPGVLVRDDSASQGRVKRFFQAVESALLCGFTSDDDQP